MHEMTLEQNRERNKNNPYRYDTYNLCIIRYCNVWVHSKHDRLYGNSVYECPLFPMKTYKNLDYLKKKIREYQKSL